MRTDIFTHSISYPWTDAVATHTFYLLAERYANNNSLAIIVMEVNDDGSEEEFDAITVNLPFGAADEKCAYIDTNNCSWAEAMLKEHKLAKPTGECGYSGFCQYPLYKFDLKKFK